MVLWSVWITFHCSEIVSPYIAVFHAFISTEISEDGFFVGIGLSVRNVTKI